MLPGTVKSWLVSFRLRTLPLSASPVIAGSFLAAYSGKFVPVVLILALATALLLQILSNISNEYGDAVRGADNESRVGPERSIQRGDITLRQMKKMMIALAVITAAAGLPLYQIFSIQYVPVLFF